MFDTKTWSGWWFMNGGSINGDWKRRRYSSIREAAYNLPKKAWDKQQEKIDLLEIKLNIAMSAMKSSVGFEPFGSGTLNPRPLSEAIEKIEELGFKLIKRNKHVLQR